VGSDGGVGIELGSFNESEWVGNGGAVEYFLRSLADVGDGRKNLYTPGTEKVGFYHTAAIAVTPSHV